MSVTFQSNLPAVNGLLRRAVVRLAGSAFLNVILRNLLIALGFLVLGRTASWLGFIQFPAGGVFYALGFLLLYASAGETLLRMPGRQDAALALDESMGTHELLTTASEMKDAPGEMPEEVRRRAEKAAGSCDISSVLPLRLNAALAVSATVLAAFIIAIPPGEPPSLAKGVLVSEAQSRGITDALVNAARELEKAGVAGLEAAVRRSDPSAAASAVVKAGDKIDMPAARGAIARLADAVRETDPELYAQLVSTAANDLSRVAGLIAGRTGGRTPVRSGTGSTVVTVNAGSSGLVPGEGTQGNAVTPGEVATGQSPAVDLELVPARHREVVRRYFE